ncbi:SusC/RagA family TonB-linked outer membrane protein [Sphingobacterium sp. UGAL515B_05]|uniref:SusC/RagA family TonB-linked outer membrane protein n=1 Tax=Sphingobacterium sp. UGAL515B_05 TaxID=2986767 RepID=UPI0029553C34|nr:SusC/RagA family TonB-linked outer membrane protein [Sphingobacterium sp. UGAL515B_05]WON94344.1 SusC/RagA family TonB-linked outer membrane protein [Sphingobacterium sp. UGAL515B_05]
MKKHDFSNRENIPQVADMFSGRKKLLRAGLKSTLFFMLLASGTAIKAQQISLSLQKAPLSKAISEIRKSTKYDFAYSEELLKKAGPISINLKNANITEVLNKMFADQPISYKIADGIIILKEKPANGNTTPSKNKETTKGRVVDENGNPLAGATIQVKGTNFTVTSDNTGSFELPSEFSDSDLMISYLGYARMEVSAKSAERIVLVTNSNRIEEVSVVASGYQSIPKERATGSFSKVDNATFNRQVSTDVISRLKGIAPSILFDERSGSPKLTIRGQATIFGNDQPLIVVDNFPYEGDINNINPNDIEDIDILKDAAAASIWGVRAGNGVIVIKTKKGRADQPMNIGFTSNLTIGQKPDLNYIPQIKPSDFIDIEKMLFEKGFYNTIISNTTNNRPYSPVVSILNDQRKGLITSEQANLQIDALRSGDLRRDMSKYLYQNSIKQQYSVDLNGGSNKYAYYFSAGFDKNKSSAKGEGFSRVSISSDQVFRPIEKLEISAGLYYNQNNRSLSNVISMLTNMGQEQMYPYATLLDGNGDASIVTKDYSNALKGKALTDGLLNWDFIPLNELGYQDNKFKQSEIRLNAAIKYKIISSVTAEARFQYENQIGKGRNFYDVDSYFMRNLINQYTTFSNSLMKRNIPLGGKLDNTNNDLKALNGRFQLNFDQRWNKHQVNAITGFEVREVKANGLSNSLYGFDPNVGSNITVDYLTEFPFYGSSSTSVIPQGNDYSETLNRIRSYYFNGAYNYDLRYVLSASARIDQSNLFGVKTNQKSIPLWSVGAKWNISKEHFYHIDWLPQLSFRSTFGYSGNVDKTITAYTTAILTYNSINTLPAATLRNPPNKNLRWEKNRMFNIGIDYGTKNNRIVGSIEYFNRLGSDLIGNSAIDPTSGFTSYRGNVANMTGSGLDVEFKTSNIITKRFRWNTTALFSIAKDKVTKYQRPTSINTFLTDNSIYRNPSNYSPVIGKPLFGIYSYPWAGLDPETGQARGYLDGVASKDYSKITQQLALDPQNNLRYNGRAIAPYFGALRNTFSYEGVELSFNITYRFGYYFRRNSIMYSSLYRNYTTHGDFYKRWQNTGDEKITNVPALIYPASTLADQYYRNSEVLVEKGDHIRLQDIVLSYSFDSKTLNALHLKSLRVSAIANNVGLLWKANKVGLDPDFPTSKMPSTFAIAFNCTL